MNRYRICLGFLIVLCLASCVSAAARSRTGVSAAVFLTDPAGARSVAMGGAGVAVPGDISGIFFNPAGLASIDGTVLMAEYDIRFADIRKSTLALNRRIKNGNLGVGFNHLQTGSQDRTGVTGAGATAQPVVGLGTFDAYDFAASVGYGWRCSRNINFGANVKWIRQSIESIQATAYAADLGAIHSMNVPWFDIAAWGLAVTNIGTQIKFMKEKEDLPRGFKAGIFLTKYFSQDRFNILLDIGRRKDANIHVNAGVEYWFHRTLALRAGYNALIEKSGDLAAGLGIRYGKISLDYAFVPFTILDDQAHRMTFLFRF
ncbi:PorV/PorQ family protein [bacterium]|nr:PorV/PorQ family protein [bacterium]